MIWFLIIFGVVLLVGFTAFTGAPYVPSKRREVRVALEKLAKLSDKDLLVDLGSGDGIVMREASKLGVRSVGYELNPVFFLVSKILAAGDKNIKIIFGNYWRADFPPETTVVYAFSDARDIKKMYKKVEQQATKLGRNIKFISYAFEVSGKELAAREGAYSLYGVNPLRDDEA